MRRAPTLPAIEQRPVTTRRIFRLWWPLAASWLLMGAEVPLVAAFITRLPDEELHLAAFGSLVYPLSVLVEAPIIMLLAASTALAKDWTSYCKLQRFMHVAGFGLTLVHGLIAFTPLFGLVAADLMHAPEGTVAPGQLGLMIMTPWTWAIAYRRLQQGVLIRFEHADAVIIGTVVRLIVVVGVLVFGYQLGDERISGIVLGSSAIAAGVLAEAVYAGWRVRPVLRDRLHNAPPLAEPLNRGKFLRFYLPLAVTPMMTLIIHPIGAAAMNRMPNPLESVAAWGPVYGLVFMTRTAGFAFNEVTVTLLGSPGGARALRRFAYGIVVCAVGVLAVIAWTPLGEVWFSRVSDLPPELTEISVVAIALASLMPGYSVLQSWYQGALVFRHRTRGITEAVALYLVVTTVCLGIGVWIGTVRGIYFAIGSFTVAGLLQTLWLRHRSAATLREALTE